jgi:hypothetical protein
MALPTVSFFSGVAAEGLLGDARRLVELEAISFLPTALAILNRPELSTGVPRSIGVKRKSPKRVMQSESAIFCFTFWNMHA